MSLAILHLVCLAHFSTTGLIVQNQFFIIILLLKHSKMSPIYPLHYIWSFLPNHSIEHQHSKIPIIIFQPCPWSLYLVRLVFLLHSINITSWWCLSPSPQPLSLSLSTQVHTHTLSFYSFLLLFLPKIPSSLFCICLHFIFSSYLAWLWAFSELLYHLSNKFN